MYAWSGSRHGPHPPLMSAWFPPFLLLALACPARAVEPVAERVAPAAAAGSGLCADLERGLTGLAGIALDGGAGLDAPDPEDQRHRPPLLCAAEAGRAEAVAFLLGRGATVDVRHTSFLGTMTPLTIAAELGHGEVVRLLLAAGASVKADSPGRSPLLRAAAEGDKRNADGYAEALRALLQAGADPNAPDGQGATALTLAAENRNAAGVALLLAHGADPNQRNGAGRTPLSFAAENRGAAVVEALLRAGATADAADLDGKAPWVRAAGRADRKVMTLLARAGAREQYDALDPSQAIPAAACEGDVALLKRLLTAAPGTAARGRGLGAAIVQAARCARIDTVRFLLDRGADPNAAQEDGETPLLAALADPSSPGPDAEARTKLAAVLLARGAAANARDAQGETPLLRAVRGGNAGAVRLLVRKKADADARDRQGSSAWALASLRGDWPLASLLERAGARPDFAALHWEGGESEVAAPLQVAVTGQEGWTALWRRALGAPAPPVDFARYFVACVFLGHATDWPYGISFGAPVVEASRLVVPFSLSMLRLEAEPETESRRGPGRRGQYAMRVFPRHAGLEIVLRGDSPEGRVPGIGPPEPSAPPRPSWAEDFRSFDARPLPISSVVSSRDLHGGTFLVTGTRPKDDRPTAAERSVYGGAPGPDAWVLEDDTGAIRVMGVPPPEPGRPVVLEARFAEPGAGPSLRGLRAVTAGRPRGTTVVRVGEFVHLPLASTKSYSSHLELSGDLASIESVGFLNAAIVRGVRPGTVTGRVMATWWNRPEPELRGEVVLEVVAR